MPDLNLEKQLKTLEQLERQRLPTQRRRKTMTPWKTEPQAAGHKASCVIADETPLKLPRIPIPGESNILDAIAELKELLERVLRELETIP